MTSPKLAALVVLFCGALASRDLGGRAEYVGGTITQIPAGCQGTVQAQDERFFVFYSGKASWRVPYEKINLVEYGEKVDRHDILSGKVPVPESARALLREIDNTSRSARANH